MESESEALREERTKQLDAAVAEDWKYQTEFKAARAEEEKELRAREAWEAARDLEEAEALDKEAALRKKLAMEQGEK